MGKTWASKCMRLMGVAVHDADTCVHRLMAASGLATPTIVEVFGDVLDQSGSVDRQKLARVVLSDDAALMALEAILHPLVRQAQRRFLQNCQRRQAGLAVLDIPLLYETGDLKNRRLDAVMVVSAPRFVQYRRVMRRPAMSAARLRAIEQRQIADVDKRKSADFIVHTGSTRGQSFRQIGSVVRICRACDGRAWTPHWGLSGQT